MKKDTLFYFKNPDEFLDFIHTLEIDEGWRIYSGTMNSRGKSIKDKSYTHLLRDTFSEKGFFRKKVSLAEIVSWLDNFLYIMRILKQLKKVLPCKKYDELEIFFEYRIYMSKNKRVDYIFKLDNKLLLFEFRTLDKFEKISTAWSKKKVELIVNRELMENYIKDKEFLTYAFIGLYEYENSKIVTKHRDYNMDQVSFAAEYIKAFMFEEND